MPTYDSDARIAWSSAVTINLLALTAMAIGMVAFPVPLYSALTYGRVAQMGLSAALLVVLVAERRQPRLDVALAAFLLAVLPQLLNYPLFAVFRESAGLGWEAFMRQRIIFILFGVVAPRQWWVSVAVIGVFVVDVCAEYWIPSWGATHFSAQHEPWVTLSFAVWGIWIARSRAVRFARERELEHKLQAAEESARMARMALAVRDLANTPLQVIELQLALLEERKKPVPKEAAPIRRALTRLKELNKVLSTYEERADVTPASFDAKTVLRLPTKH